MAIKLFKNDTQAQCGCCEHAQITESGDVVCRKIGGVMQLHSKCKKYKYDPLKREPKLLLFNGEYSKEDFEI